MRESQQRFSDDSLTLVAIIVDMVNSLTARPMDDSTWRHVREWTSLHCEYMGDLLVLPDIDLVRCRFVDATPLRREYLKELFGDIWRKVERGARPTVRQNVAVPIRQQLEEYTTMTRATTAVLVPTSTLLSSGNIEEFLGRWACETWANIAGIAEHYLLPNVNVDDIGLEAFSSIENIDRIFLVSEFVLCMEQSLSRSIIGHKVSHSPVQYKKL